MKLQKRKIPVLENESAIPEILEIWLQSWEFGVIPAVGGKKGKGKAELFDPDIVISDVIMTSFASVGLLQILRAGNQNRPIILITAQFTIGSSKAGAGLFPADERRLVSGEESQICYALEEIMAPPAFTWQYRHWSIIKKPAAIRLS
jgi:CheY-like chemotaxis protein